MLCLLYSFLTIVFSILSPFWLHFGAPKAAWEPSKSSFFRTWIQEGLQEALRIDVGLILEPILLICGSILGGLGEILATFWEGFGESFGSKEKLGCS